MSRLRLDVVLAFERSWRIGSGEAAGRHLDDLVRRDGHGLPFVPGTTLRGQVADAVRRLAGLVGEPVCDGTVERRDDRSPRSLCGVNRHEPACPVCVLTGSNHHPAAVDFGPARLLLADDDGRRLWEPRDRRRLAEAAQAVPALLTRPRARTAIDGASGRAKDEHLFTLEEAQAGLELAATLGIDRSGPELNARHLALLVGALRFVREVGGGRRRGLGACRVRIESAELRPFFGSWREAVESLAGPGAGAEPGPEPGPAVPAPVADPAAGDPPTVLALDALVVGEVALGRRPEAGNLVSGLPFVPGSTLRGALAARWRGGFDSDAFRRVFLSGRVRFGFLYPLGRQVAGTPTPLSRHTCKLRPGEPPEGHGIVDLLERPGKRVCGPDCPGLLVPADLGFAGVPEEEGRALVVSPHNRIDFESQTVRQGGLFAYEVIPEGRRLRGFLRADDPDDLALLLAGTGLGLDLDDGFELRVGRRKGVMGHLACRLGRFPGVDGGVGLFPDAEPVPEEWPEGWAMRVDLLTPAIVLDRTPEGALGFRETLVPGDLELERESFDGAYAASEIVAGWNAAHRLPKADELAVRAGSSYLLRRPDDGAEEELRTLAAAAAAGIGRRRTEGFGAIAVTRVEIDESPGGDP